MNKFARFDENPVMTLQDNKETKFYGWTHNVKQGWEQSAILNQENMSVDSKIEKKWF